jgi:hypothetical protein
MPNKESTVKLNTVIKMNRSKTIIQTGNHRFQILTLPLRTFLAEYTTSFYNRYKKKMYFF